MKKASLVLIAFLTLTFGGCALLDTIAPPQYDEQGNAIAASRQPTFITRTVADTIPYGESALGLILFVAAGYERFRANKLEKGLKATLLAGKKVAKDPKMKDMWDKVKDDYYREAHENAGVTALIKGLLAKLPHVPKKA